MVCTLNGCVIVVVFKNDPPAVGRDRSNSYALDIFFSSTGRAHLAEFGISATRPSDFKVVSRVTSRLKI
jgi:hypothetical protein